MTQGIEKMLNIASSDKEEDSDIFNATEFNPSTDLMRGVDHDNSMDKVYDETIKHARDLMDFGFNVDPRSAGRMFEIAATMYQRAIEAKTSKRDAQLKELKLIIEKNKLKKEDDVPTENAIIVEDRNELLRQLREKHGK